MNKTSQDIINAWNKANSHNGKGKHNIPKLTKAEVVHKWKQLKKVLSEQGKERTYEYFYNSSINCYRYLSDTTLMVEERFIWRLVHLTSTGVAAFVIWVVATSSLNHPTGISQTPDGIPLSEIPYPAVAICPLNLLSKRRVQEYAKNFVKNNYDSENATIEEINNLIYKLGYLGHSYDHIESPNDELYDLHNTLQNNYDLRNLMESLSPQCKDILVRCVWRGNLTDCSKIFVQRKTASGFCCTFNYVRLGDSDFGLRRNRSDAIMAVYGQERGLSAVVNPELEDYFYTRMPNAGLKVMIFNPVDYPDLSTGGGLDMYVAPKAEQYFSMSATVLKASESLVSLDLKTRQCLIETDPFSYDTNSECYLICKLGNIHATCGCIPFYLPIQKHRTCDLQDEECLRRWKNAWTTAWLNEDADEDENGRPIESNKPLPCSCLPSCADVKYKVQKYSIVLQPDALNAQNDSAKLPLKRQVVFQNHSVLHIFFAKDNFVLLQNDVLFSWYDWLSNLGGLCGLVLGCSILSFAEIIYYFIFGGPVKDGHKREPPARQLYWQELRRM